MKWLGASASRSSGVALLAHQSGSVEDRRIASHPARKNSGMSFGRSLTAVSAMFSCPRAHQPNATAAGTTRHRITRRAFRRDDIVRMAAPEMIGGRGGSRTHTPVAGERILSPFGQSPQGTAAKDVTSKSPLGEEGSAQNMQKEVPNVPDDLLQIMEVWTDLPRFIRGVIVGIIQGFINNRP